MSNKQRKGKKKEEVVKEQERIQSPSADKLQLLEEEEQQLVNRDFELPIVINKFYKYDKVGDFYHINKQKGIPALCIREIGLNKEQLDEYLQTIPRKFPEIFIKPKGYSSYTDKFGTIYICVFEELKYSLDDVLKFKEAAKEPFTLEQAKDIIDNVELLINESDKLQCIIDSFDFGAHTLYQTRAYKYKVMWPPLKDILPTLTKKTYEASVVDDYLLETPELNRYKIIRLKAAYIVLRGALLDQQRIQKITKFFKNDGELLVERIGQVAVAAVGEEFGRYIEDLVFNQVVPRVEVIKPEQFVTSIEKDNYEPDYNTYPNAVKTIVDNVNTPNGYYIGWYDPDTRQRIGKGKYYDRDSVYFGQWRDNKQNGLGIRIWYSSLEKYVGEFVDGNMNGRGLHFDKNDKLIYNGYWKDNVFNGPGELLLVNGQKYKGNFVNGVIEGIGELCYPRSDSPFLRGNFGKGLKNDRFEVYDADGVIKKKKVKFVDDVVIPPDYYKPPQVVQRVEGDEDQGEQPPPPPPYFDEAEYFRLFEEKRRADLEANGEDQIETQQQQQQQQQINEQNIQEGEEGGVEEGEISRPKLNYEQLEYNIQQAQVLVQSIERIPDGIIEYWLEKCRSSHEQILWENEEDSQQLKQYQRKTYIFSIGFIRDLQPKEDEEQIINYQKVQLYTKPYYGRDSMIFHIYQNLIFIDKVKRTRIVDKIIPQQQQQQGEGNNNIEEEDTDLAQPTPPPPIIEQEEQEYLSFCCLVLTYNKDINKFIFKLYEPCVQNLIGDNLKNHRLVKGIRDWLLKDINNKAKGQNDAEESLKKAIAQAEYSFDTTKYTETGYTKRGDGGLEICTYIQFWIQNNHSKISEEYIQATREQILNDFGLQLYQDNQEDYQQEQYQENEQDENINEDQNENYDYDNDD